MKDTYEIRIYEKRPNTEDLEKDFFIETFDSKFKFIDFINSWWDMDFDNLEDCLDFLFTIDHEDETPIPYYVRVEDEVIIDDIDYFENEMWEEIEDEWKDK